MVPEHELHSHHASHCIPPSLLALYLNLDLLLLLGAGCLSIILLRSWGHPYISCCGWWWCQLGKQATHDPRSKQQHLLVLRAAAEGGVTQQLVEEPQHRQLQRVDTAANGKAAAAAAAGWRQRDWCSGPGCM